MPSLLPAACRASRQIAFVAAVSGPLLSRVAGGRQASQALVLAALALGMPHGAADAELLRAAARGDRRRHAGLVLSYAAAAAGATAVVRRGGRWVERAVLVGSAAHFAEGELACWPDPPAGRRRTQAPLRLVAAVTVTLALPTAVGTANRTREVGATGALELSPRAAGERSGLELLWAGDHQVRALTLLAGTATAGLLASRDREPAADSALLAVLALLAPPSTAFAGYFGGWHALRHTARVVDALVASGQLPAQTSLPGAVAALGRRSAWAAASGLLVAGVLAARDPRHASDHAFAAVLGLTVPHMVTVAVALTGRQARQGR